MMSQGHVINVLSPLCSLVIENCAVLCVETFSTCTEFLYRSPSNDREGPRDLPTPTIDIGGWPVGMWRVIWAAEGVLGAEMSHFDNIDARARMCQNDL